MKFLQKVLVPALFAGVVYVVAEDYKAQFVNQVRSQSYLLASLLEKNVEALCVLDAEGHGIGVVGTDELVWAYAREGYESLIAEDIMSEGVPELPPVACRYISPE